MINMDIIKGNKVMLTPLKLEDAFFMKKWGKHETPLLSDYNFPYYDDEDIIEWYNSKKSSRRRIYFIVYNEEKRAIGYLGIKSIRRISKKATLGIVFDPNYVDKGYGTDAINAFLDYFFNTMKMKTLLLEVAGFNKRAIRCYEKCGFMKYDQYLDIYHDQNIDRNNKYFKNEKNNFVIKRGKIYNFIYRMKVDNNTYYEMREEIDKNKT